MMVDIILTAATQVLARTGLEDMTTNQIAERAGVSVASVYQYFPNKESIASALIERHLQLQGKLFEAFVASQRDQPIEVFIDGLLGLLTKIFLGNEPLVQQMRRFGPQLNAHTPLVAVRDLTARLLVEELRRRRPDYSERQAERITFTLMNACLGMMYGYVGSNTHGITEAELGEEMQQLTRKLLI